MSARCTAQGRFPFAASIALLLVAISLLSAPGVSAKSARYQRFDVDVVLQADGSYHVTETQVVGFVDGPFGQGYRSIPVARTNGITNLSVSEIVDGVAVAYRETGGTAGARQARTFEVDAGATDVNITWWFDPAYSESRTFVVEYDMVDALRVYTGETPPNQQVWFTAISAELTSETPIDASRLTVTLPEPVDLAAVVVESDGPDIAQQLSPDGRVFTWEKTGFGSGDDFTVRLQFPIVLPEVAAPSWQAEDDAKRAREERSESRQSVLHVMMLAAGLVLLAGGGIGLYGLWYTRGRDPHTGLVADFLPNPPDNLSPGAAGALVDEYANESDIVATLLDLARRGEITLTDIGLLGPNKRATGHDYLLEVKSPGENHAPHEQRMLRAVFGANMAPGSKARLNEIAGRVINNYPEFRNDLYAELVKRGYFNRSPEATRRSWKLTGFIVAVAGGLGAVAGWLVLDAFAFIPGIAIVAMGLVAWRLASAMPRKTPAGAEAAAKWSAFKRYLASIERYENLAESRQIFDRHLAFAVAFGLERSWVEKFARVATPIPTWFGPGDVLAPEGHGSWGTGNWGQPGTGGGVNLPDIGLPGLPDFSSASKKASGGLQSGSSGLMNLLKIAGAIIEIASAFSGGGGKGGSSGGGRGGFS